MHGGERERVAGALVDLVFSLSESFGAFLPFGVFPEYNAGRITTVGFTDLPIPRGGVLHFVIGRSAFLKGGFSTRHAGMVAFFADHREPL